MRRVNRIEEEPRDLNTRLEHAVHQIQILPEELSKIHLGEAKRDLSDKTITVSDTIKILTPPISQE